MKKEEPDLAEVLKFLGQMQKIDRSGQDGGWAFEGLVFNDDIPPADVKVSLRGEHDLVKATRVAMTILSGVEL